MEMDTILSEEILSAKQRIQYDAACKRILTIKIILAWILKHTVTEFVGVDVNQIAEQCIEGPIEIGTGNAMDADEEAQLRIAGMSTAHAALEEGETDFDIRFYAIVPGAGERIRLIVNLEAQRTYHPGYPLMMRAIFYCGRLLSRQYGEEFAKSHYEKVKKVYSIWICMNAPRNRQNTINQYSMAERNLVGDAKEPVRHYDLLSVVMICLGTPEEAEEASLLRMLDVLFAEQMQPEAKLQVLEDEFAIRRTYTIQKEVADMSNLILGAVERAYDKGVDKGIDIGIDKGINIGIDKGINIGIDKGINIGTTKKELELIYTVMNQLGKTSDEVMDLFRTPQEKRAEFREQLAQYEKEHPAPN